MTTPGHPDMFVVANGPEDGTEFPITRSPFAIGRDFSCAVNVRLDASVNPFHARVTVVPDGYRIRTTDGTPVVVDGRRAGLVKSRVLRPGGYVQVGHTLLALECAPDGLANRSRGMVTESDLVWACRQGARMTFRGLRRTVQTVLNLLYGIVSSWIGITAIVAIIFLMWSPLRNQTVDTVQAIVEVVVNLFRNLIDRFMEPR